MHLINYGPLWPILSFWPLLMHFGLLTEKCQKKVLIDLRHFLSNMHAKPVSSTHCEQLLLLLAFLLQQPSSLALAPIKMSSILMRFFKKYEEAQRWSIDGTRKERSSMTEYCAT